MLISKAPDEDDHNIEECASPAEDDSHEYQTASELFELMARNPNFSSNDGGTLTPRDLVLLYKNIDLNAKVISNRRVETIVYSDDPESDGSDISEVYSNEDLRNIMLINKEQIDFLNSHSSVENKLCHKLGDLEIQTSADNEYDKHFLFKDPYIKEQLKNFNLFSNNDGIDASVLPASLLDYVCCKRLEDNYNFYMDNIIRYVKNTIDQLKRISNGDYLTDKAKEKWREVENAGNTSEHNTKVLATSTSIPLHVECKIGGLKSTWDDIVHSAVDVRSLSKILEKKIIIEIPKLINGSFTLLSKCCADNLIISCKQDYQQIEDSKKSRVDVLLQLKRSKTGEVVSNIKSIMFLQPAPIVQDLPASDGPLPLMYEEMDDASNDRQENDIKITELDTTNEDDVEEEARTVEDENVHYEEDSDNFNSRRTENICNTSFNSSSQEGTTESSGAINSHLDKVKRSQKEASFDMCPDDLRMTIQRLATQHALPEESLEDLSQTTVTKKKSPTRIRIKSPYENKSYILEEKKRRKLLEIRERREKKKMAMAENCKITKHKYGKGVVMPQASSSVTKLSITNKSFYNSIYGNIDAKLEAKQTNNKNRKKDLPKDLQEEFENFASVQEKPTEETVANSKKFINRSYYLDDTVTEMMYMNMKRQEKDVNSGSTSAVSSDFRSGFNMFSQLMSPFVCDLNVPDEKPHSPATPKHLLIGPSDSEGNQESHTKELAASQSALNIVPANSPKALHRTGYDKNDLRKVLPSIECRRSIDKLYQLVTKLGKNQCPTRTKPQSIFSTNTSTAANMPPAYFLQGSDSGTSLKPNVSPSNPSSFSFSKNNSAGPSNIFDKKPPSPTTVTKVIISSKSQIPVPKNEVFKKDRRKSGSSPTNRGQDSNPLKAISQLLHEFDNVQRKRLKSGTEQRSTKKTDAYNDVKNMSRQETYKKRSRLEQTNDFMDRYANRAATWKEKKTRPVTGLDGLKIPYQQVPVDDKTADRSSKKKITEILDEAKEARGEAVRGPSKFTSRLNSLAQPKRTYVQAHSEEYQTRYGRNLITDRLQRLASAPSPLSAEKCPRMANPRNKIKRTVNEADFTASSKQAVSSGFPIERPHRTRGSPNHSPIAKERASSGGGLNYKHLPIEKPEALKKKMFAVESYVKNHYGHNSHESRILQKSRAPLLPNDVEIALTPSSTLLESTEAGSNLHRIIESMMTTTSHGLDVLTECLETNSRSSRDNTDDIFNSPRCDEGISIDSDYTSGTTDDSVLVTSNDNSSNVDKYRQQQTNFEDTDCTKNQLQPLKSLEKLPLCSNLSLGTFSKHLKINNFAATPRPSIQKLLLLQSGDTSSLVVKASISQTDKLLKLKRMPVLSKTHWNLRFPNIPMQITTVGYAFPEYNAGPRVPPTSNRLLGEVTKNLHKATLVSHKGAKKSLLVDEPHVDQNHCNTKQLPSPIEQTAHGEIPKFSATSKHNIIPEETSCCSNNGTSKCISVQAITDDEEGRNCRNETKITQTTALEEKCTSETSKKPDDIDYTTSLDILVGLLNEIQKITTCQTHITSNESDKCKELEMLLNKTAALENSIGSSAYNNVSITSLDKLRCLDSNPSLYSFYISDNDEANRRNSVIPNLDPWYETKNNAYHTTIYADKEINVDITNKEYVNTLTDVPSIFFPATINTSTNMANTLVEDFCQSSIQSLLFTDYQPTHSNVLSLKSTPSNNSSKTVLELLPQVKRSKENTQHNANHQKCKELKLHKQKSLSIANGAIVKKNLVFNKNNTLMTSDFDPVMKLKRDILVTVYSMLVLTVFAALSFPEVLYHVM